MSDKNTKPAIVLIPSAKCQDPAAMESLDKLLASAIRSAKTMREKIQKGLVACVSYWTMTKSNVGLAGRVNRFIAEVGQGVNLKAIRSWCEKHLHMTPNADGTGLVFKQVKASKLNTAMAAKDNWWTHKPQKDIFKLDLASEILALADKVSRAKTREGQKGLVMDDALETKLRELRQAADATIKARQPEPAH